MTAEGVTSAARTAGRRTIAVLGRGLGFTSPLALFVFFCVRAGTSFAFFFVDDVALMRAEDATVRTLAVTALSLVVRAVPVLGAAHAAGFGDSLGRVLPGFPFFLFLAAFSVIACLLVHYRERFVDQRERIEQLEGAVAKLTETNLGYQNYASEASSRSQKEERLRITRELHDTIGYTVTLIAKKALRYTI